VQRYGVHPGEGRPGFRSRVGGQLPKDGIIFHPKTNARAGAQAPQVVTPCKFATPGSGTCRRIHARRAVCPLLQQAPGRAFAGSLDFRDGTVQRRPRLDGFAPIPAP
jgi:hypothetical protein